MPVAAQEDYVDPDPIPHKHSINLMFAAWNLSSKIAVQYKHERPKVNLAASLNRFSRDLTSERGGVELFKVEDSIATFRRWSEYNKQHDIRLGIERKGTNLLNSYIGVNLVIGMLKEFTEYIYDQRIVPNGQSPVAYLVQHDTKMSYYDAQLKTSYFKLGAELVMGIETMWAERFWIGGRAAFDKVAVFKLKEEFVLDPDGVFGANPNFQWVSDPSLLEVYFGFRF
jgi:hypothetical protein